MLTNFLISQILLNPTTNAFGFSNLQIVFQIYKFYTMSI